MFSAELPVYSLCAGGAFPMLVFFDQYLNGLFLYCSAASKHKQLLVTEICGDDHSGQGSANYQCDTSGKYRSVRTAVSGWILFSGVLYLFIQKCSAWGPYLAKGLSNSYLLTALALAMRSCQSSYCANSAPADAVLEIKPN